MRQQTLVYLKSNETMQAETEKFAATNAHFEVCPFYILNQNGQARDTWSLSLLELLDICLNKKSLKFLKFTQKDAYCPYPAQTITTYTDLNNLLDRFDAETDKENRDFILKFICENDGNKFLKKARTIAKYKTLVENQNFTERDVVSNYAKYEQGQKNIDFNI